MAEARAFDELLHETSCDRTEAHLLSPGDTLLIAAPDYWVQTYAFSSYFTGDAKFLNARFLSFGFNV